jgi:ubiquinone biosynthesis UbiH/UbiF/VisC/COQ6 family hydroxylase
MTGAAPAAIHQCDILIAGAGLVGLALAPAVARAGLRVIVADRAPLIAVDAAPAGWDTRIYAISPGSAAYLRAVGAWQALPVERVGPVETMRIAGDDGALVNFSAYENGERALAWIVEERALRAALLPQLCEAGVAWVAPCLFDGIDWAADAATLRLADGGRIAARLVVGADGIRSWVRDEAGIEALPRPYGQTGVVASFDCEKAHHGRAYQWFRPDGSILAWLPLPGRRVSMVWSAPQSLATELLAQDAPALAERVAAAGRHVLGDFACITAAAGFPLQYLRPSTVVAHRLALVGDAAHGVHPLAGQGVNLGFGDAEVLAALLRDRGPVTDPGSPLLLERYARRRTEPVFAMQAVTDGLARLFGNPAPWLKSARNLGMAAVEALPFAKRLLAQTALR